MHTFCEKFEWKSDAVNALVENGVPKDVAETVRKKLENVENYDYITVCFSPQAVVEEGKAIDLDGETVTEKGYFVVGNYKTLECKRVTENAKCGLTEEYVVKKCLLELENGSVAVTWVTYNCKGNGTEKVGGKITIYFMSNNVSYFLY